MTKEVRERARQFLRENNLAVIATVTTNAESRPEAAVIHYFTDDLFNFYFITRRHTRKFKNLQLNPHIAIVVGTTLMPHTIQMEGVAELLKEKEELLDFQRRIQLRPELHNLYLGAFSGSVFPKIRGLDFAVFRVKIKWLRWMDLDEETLDEKYHQILPE